MKWCSRIGCPPSASVYDIKQDPLYLDWTWQKKFSWLTIMYLWNEYTVIIIYVNIINYMMLYKSLRVHYYRLVTDVLLKYYSYTTSYVNSGTIVLKTVLCLLSHHTKFATCNLYNNILVKINKSIFTLCTSCSNFNYWVCIINYRDYFLAF